MREYFRSLLALGVLLTSASALQAAAVPGGATLVDQGEAVGRIVVPAKATDAEALAARQVQTFVKQMSGAELPIVKADDKAGAGPAIVIGNQPANKAVIDELNKEHPDTIDAFAVVGKGDDLSLVGRSDDSTMWAAWQWLNDQGVVFVMPGEHGNFVPHKTSIEITPINDIEAPRVAARGSYSIMANKDCNPKGLYTPEEGLPAWKMFMFRMRMNYNTAFNEMDRFSVMGSGNSYSSFLPPAKYYKEHPDWYSTPNGKAPVGIHWQICFTSKAAAAEYAKNMLGALKHQLDRGVPMNQLELLVTPNDGLAICSTPEGRKLIDKDGSYSSLVTNFANMVAEHIHKVYPKARIVFLAYSNYATPPDYVKPGPNVCQIITAWPAADSLAVNMAHPLFSEANHKYQNAFEEWSKTSGGLGAYTYYGHYNWFTPWPMTTQMAHDIPTMCADAKFFHMYSENHPSWGTQGLTMWLYPKLLWNPKLDVQAAVADYDRAAFGPAADAMQSYQKALQASMDRQGRIGGNVWEIPFVLTPAVIDQCNGFIAQAQKLEDKMDPDTRWRTELACQAWQASAKFGEAVGLFTHGKTVADRTKILSLCDEVNQFAQTDMGKWAFDNTVATRSIKVVTAKFKVDPSNLQPGKQIFNDGFNFGGAIKFCGKVSGFQTGMWGYILPVNKDGEIDLQLKAAAGHQITSANVKWNIPHPERLSGTLSVVTDKQGEHVLTSDVKQLVKGVDLPADALGGIIRLKLHMVNQHYDPTIVLTGCRIETQVK